MKKAVGYYAYFLKVGTIASTVGLALSVLAQIYSRFFMENAPSWTEEASRLFFIYAISFAAGLAYKQNYFVSLDLISAGLGHKMHAFLEKTIHGLVFILFLITAVFSIAYINIGLAEKSPSLGMNMSVSFASIFLMSFSISFFSAQKIIQLQRKNT
jgi:TRAP-type C4-dicarboxylate transport system permease small subunit